MKYARIAIEMKKVIFKLFISSSSESLIKKANFISVLWLLTSVLFFQSVRFCSKSINAGFSEFQSKLQMGHLRQLFHSWSASEVFIAPINQTLAKCYVPFVSQRLSEISQLTKKVGVLVLSLWFLNRNKTDPLSNAVVWIASRSKVPGMVLPCYGDICMHRGQTNVSDLASLHSQSEVWSAVINWDVSDRNLSAK